MRGQNADLGILDFRHSCLRQQKLQKFKTDASTLDFQRTYTMPKRRRERDRPKAAPDAPYDPNKRVLLSYESDEEGEVQDDMDVTDQQALLARPVATYTENGAEEDEAQIIAGAEATLPDQEEDSVVEQEDGDVYEDDEEQHANQASLWTRGGVRKNENTGQWAALGSLAYQYEDGEEEEEFESEEEEAMAYLRAVR